MERVRAYLAKAEQAERTARTIEDPHDRQLLLAIAQEWRDLSKQAEALAEWEAAQAAREAAEAKVGRR